MNNLIIIDEYESSVIAGGYDENIANLVEARNCIKNSFEIVEYKK